MAATLRTRRTDVPGGSWYQFNSLTNNERQRLRSDGTLGMCAAPRPVSRCVRRPVVSPTTTSVERKPFFRVRPKATRSSYSSCCAPRGVRSASGRCSGSSHPSARHSVPPMSRQCASKRRQVRRCRSTLAARVLDAFYIPTLMNPLPGDDTESVSAHESQARGCDTTHVHCQVIAARLGHREASGECRRVRIDGDRRSPRQRFVPRKPTA
jgi:hypothetical protein